MIAAFQPPFNIMDVVNNFGFLVGITGFISGTVSLIYALKIKRKEPVKSEADQIKELLGKIILSNDIPENDTVEFWVKRAAEITKKDTSKMLEQLYISLAQIKCRAEKLIEQIKRKEETINGES